MDPEKRRAEIAARLAELIEGDELTLQQLADKFGKRARSTVTGWKKGRAQPSLEVLAELLQHYGRSADWLLGLVPQATLEIAEPENPYQPSIPAQERIDGTVEAKAVEVQLNAFMDELRKRLRGIEETVDRLAESPKRRAR